MNTANELPYIAKIDEIYKTGNGNLFCREEGKSEFEHHLDWPIFIPKEIADNVFEIPFYGIIITVNNPAFFNDGRRLTCRTISKDIEALETIIEKKDDLTVEVETAIRNYQHLLLKENEWDRICKKAILDFKSLKTVKDWIDSYNELYQEIYCEIGISPPHDFSKFKSIKKFTSLFSVVSSLY